MHRPADIGHAVRAVILGDDDAGSDRKAHEEIDDQVDQGTGRADCRQGVAAGETSDDDHVRRVEQQLQEVHGHDRQGKKQNFAKQRPAVQIVISLAHPDHRQRLPPLYSAQAAIFGDNSRCPDIKNVLLNTHN